MMGGGGDVNGEINTTQRSCQAISGIPINHLPVVLGREIKRGQIKNRKLKNIGNLSRRDGRRSMVITIIVTCDASVLDKKHIKRYNVINKN